MDRSAVHRTKNDGAEARRGGKRAQNQLQNRQAILTAAREVFAEVGYEAASVRDIIGRTGLASGTFYNYTARRKRSRERSHRMQPYACGAHGAITPIAPIRLDTSKNRGPLGLPCCRTKGIWH